MLYEVDASGEAVVEMNSSGAEVDLEAIFYAQYDRRAVIAGVTGACGGTRREVFEVVQASAGTVGDRRLVVSHRHGPPQRIAQRRARAIREPVRFFLWPSHAHAEDLVPPAK